MKLILLLTIFSVLVTSMPQDVPPPDPMIPPGVPFPSEQPPPVPAPSTKTIYSPAPAPTQPAPVPAPPPSSPVEPMPPATPSTSDAPSGAICECGYTYCGSVLMDMPTPWSEKQLTAAYCSTPNAVCTNGTPSSNVTTALYICLCDDTKDDKGTDLDVLCGCDNCLVVAPDYRGRCATPCYSGQYCNNNAGGGGSVLLGPAAKM